MNKKDVVAFFDSLAAVWDNDRICNEDVIGLILDKSCVFKGKRILDVACGTGVLFPYYESREVASVTGIDISFEMTKLAKQKFPQTEVICADAETYCFEKQFDSIVIYNAFPHFVNPQLLFENLSKSLKPCGRMTVAHGMSEAEIEQCHSSAAKSVSNPLPQKEKLAEIMSEFLTVDIMISDADMYMVSGVKTKK